MGGAVALVKPANLGVIKRVACGVGGLAIASMLSDEAVAYVGKTLRSVTDSVKVVFVKKETVYESENSEITE